MLIDTFEADANFVSTRHMDVAAPAPDVWRVLPDLPVVLRRSRLAILAAVPLLLATLMRGDAKLGEVSFGRAPWRLREREVLMDGPNTKSNALWVERVDEGREVVLLGRHRFADYATSFFIEPIGPKRSCIHNVTRARVRTSGLGRIYLAGVRVFHTAYIDWMLRRLRDRAEAR